MLLKDHVVLSKPSFCENKSFGQYLKFFLLQNLKNEFAETETGLLDRLVFHLPSVSVTNTAGFLLTNQCSPAGLVVSSVTGKKKNSNNQVTELSLEIFATESKIKLKRICLSSKKQTQTINDKKIIQDNLRNTTQPNPSRHLAAYSFFLRIHWPGFQITVWS